MVVCDLLLAESRFAKDWSSSKGQPKHKDDQGIISVLCKYREAKKTDCLVPFLLWVESYNQSVWLTCVYTVLWWCREDDRRSRAYFNVQSVLRSKFLICGFEATFIFKEVSGADPFSVSVRKDGICQPGRLR